MYAAWNRVSGDVDNWSSRFDLVLLSEEVQVGKGVEVELDE